MSDTPNAPAAAPVETAPAAAPAATPAAEVKAVPPERRRDGPEGQKRPQATFGDVMKGTRAGQGGDRGGDRGGRGGGGGGGDRRGPKGGKGGPDVRVVRKGDEVTPNRPTQAIPSHLVYSRALEEVGGEGEGGNESFAEMFAQSSVKTVRASVKPGQQVHGVIIQIGVETAFLTLEQGGEGFIEMRELLAEGGKAPEVGDHVHGVVVAVGGREGGVKISKGLAKGTVDVSRLEVAMHGGIPVEGMVTANNKGGLEIDLGGGVRGFCPISQIDARFVEDPAKFVGQKLQFRVTEVRDGDVVLSRRALLEAEKAAAAAKTREQLAVGARLKGKVTRLQPFGAFIDLGGIEGLLHVSELSHARVTHPRDLLTEGQDVEVEVLRIDAAEPQSPDKNKHKERIALSLRTLTTDPWTTAAAQFTVGTRTKGKVVRIQPFGAFIELAPGVDGLVHISAMSDKRIAHPKDVVSEGQEVEVVVERVEPEIKRIGLAIWREGYVSPSAPETASAPRPKVGAVVEATVDKIETFGVFVTFPGGRGLVPAAETGTPRGSDLRKAFPAGTVFKAQIIEIDTQGRLRLSLTAAEMAEERAELNAYLATAQPQGKAAFGTFADLFNKKRGK